MALTKWTIITKGAGPEAVEVYERVGDVGPHKGVRWHVDGAYVDAEPVENRGAMLDAEWDAFARQLTPLA